MIVAPPQPVVDMRDLLAFAAGGALGPRGGVVLVSSNGSSASGKSPVSAQGVCKRLSRESDLQIARPVRCL